MYNVRTYRNRILNFMSIVQAIFSVHLLLFYVTYFRCDTTHYLLKIYVFFFSFRFIKLPEKKTTNSNTFFRPLYPQHRTDLSADKFTVVSLNIQYWCTFFLSHAKTFSINFSWQYDFPKKKNYSLLIIKDRFVLLKLY